MFIRFAIILLAVAPLWSQVDTTAAVPAAGDVTDTGTQMATPPPVSGESYPTAGTAETRSNYLRGGLTFNTAYSDNTLGGSTGSPVSDVTYSIWPTIALDQTTPRMHSVLTYSPGFTFYQRTSGRNEADQNLGLDLKFRLSPHVTLGFQDSFHKSSSVFNQPDLASAVPVSGSGEAPPIAVIAPISDMLNNNGNVEISYQFAANKMVGASGSFSNLHYLDASQVQGLADSSSRGGSAFYSYRLSKRHYLGGTYRYQRYLTFPTGGQDETQTHTISIFYTLYLKPTLSLSFTGGPQHSEVAQPPFSTSRSWSPATTASFGWQGRRTNLAGNYSRTITSGGGLLGAFHSNSAGATAQRQLTRTWSVSASANYAIYKNASPFMITSSQAGHTVSGSASVHHQLGQHLNAEAGYTRLHQSFSNVAAIAGTPDTNREYVSITYQFTRPLGR